MVSAARAVSCRHGARASAPRSSASVWDEQDNVGSALAHSVGAEKILPATSDPAAPRTAWYLSSWSVWVYSDTHNMLCQGPCGVCWGMVSGGASIGVHVVLPCDAADGVNSCACIDGAPTMQCL
jgi:hypothetical protein